MCMLRLLYAYLLYYPNIQFISQIRLVMLVPAPLRQLAHDHSPNAFVPL